MPISKFLYETAKWRHKVRKQVLHNSNYHCARCHTDLRNAKYSAHVHHVIPTEHAPQLAYDVFNLEALCIHCHNKEHGRGRYGCTIDGSPLNPKHPWNSQ